MPDEEKIFKSPEEKKREEKLVEEKPAGGVEEAKKKQEIEKLEGKTPVLKKTLALEAKPAPKPSVPTPAPAGAKPKEKKEKEAKPKREVVLQRVYTIPLADAYAKPRSLRGNAASRMLRVFLAKHFKTDADKIRIDVKLANALHARGSRKPPKKISVNASKDKEGIVFAELHA